MGYLETARSVLARLRNDEALTKPAPLKPSAQEVAAMGIERFARAGLIIQVTSEVLGCDVLFASDDVPQRALQHQGLVVYHAEELRRIRQLPASPSEVMIIHALKRVFGGKVSDLREAIGPRADESAKESKEASPMEVFNLGDPHPPFPISPPS